MVCGAQEGHWSLPWETNPSRESPTLLRPQRRTVQGSLSWYVCSHLDLCEPPPLRSPWASAELARLCSHPGNARDKAEQSDRWRSAVPAQLFSHWEGRGSGGTPLALVLSRACWVWTLLSVQIAGHPGSSSALCLNLLSSHPQGRPAVSAPPSPAPLTFSSSFWHEFDASMRMEEGTEGKGLAFLKLLLSEQGGSG